MTTSRDAGSRRRRRKVAPGRLALAAALALQWLAAEPAAAQRRRGEPEANPDFQNQVGGQGNGGQPGQPMDQGQGAAAPAFPQPPAGAPGAAEPMAQPEAAPRAQGIQIGGQAAPVAPPAPSNPLETRVTVRVKDAPLATFLDTISAQAKVNFIITEGLTQKRVTAFLQNVQVREALQILLELKGLTYQQIGHSTTYVVSQRSQNAPNQITRIYVLNHVPLIPLLGAENGVQGGGGGGLNLQQLAGGQQAQGVQQQGQNGQPGGPGAGRAGGNSPIAIINVINSLLTPSGRVAVDPRTNSVIVTDIPEVFPQVEQIIAELDKKVPQVMIEAQIVEINSNLSNELGITWGGTGGIASFTPGTRITTFPLNLGSNLSKAHFFEPSTLTAPAGSNLAGAIVPGGGGPTFGPITAGTVNLSLLSVVLHAIVIRGEGRFLAKPKIMTLNNKKARIEITRNEIIDLQQQLGGVGGNIQAATPERQQTGVVLEVTPQVNKEGYITMLVEPTFTDTIDSPFSAAQQTFKDTVTRKASTLLRLKTGQTVVLGGLLESNESKTVKKVPFLGYIPLIGWLFTESETTRKNQDLVIFLTPTVVLD